MKKAMEGKVMVKTSIGLRPLYLSNFDAYQDYTQELIRKQYPNELKAFQEDKEID